jgi:hypothetical protein
MELIIITMIIMITNIIIIITKQTNKQKLKVKYKVSKIIIINNK